MGFTFNNKVFCINGNDNSESTFTFYSKKFKIGGDVAPVWRDVVISGIRSVTLANAKTNGLNYLKLFGACEQTATPTPDVPIDIISNNGAIKYSLNMANVNEQTALVGYFISNTGVVMADPNNWIYQDFIPVKPNTTYTLTMSTSVYYVTISEYSTTDDSGFIRRNTGRSGDNTTLTITTSSTSNYIRFGTNINRTAVTLDRVLEINWMLNQGNSLPYAPYSPTGIYTDGTIETVEITGKNLYNKENGVLFGYPTTNNTWYQRTSDSAELSILVKLDEGKTYTATRAMGSTASFRIHASATPTLTNGQTLVNISNTGGVDVTTKTFTVPVGYPYVVFYVRNTTSQSSLTVDDVINAFQVELGSTATDYEPYYNGGTATAEMLLKVGTYQDVQNVTNGHITRNVGVKVLDGTEDWSRTDVRTKLVLTDSALGSADWGLYCTHYQSFFGSASIGNMPDNSCKINVNTNELLVKDATHNTDLATWKQYLADQHNAGTPVIVVYPLAEPTTESVTHQHLGIQAGTNIVEITQASMDNLELEVKYKGIEGE